MLQQVAIRPSTSPRPGLSVTGSPAELSQQQSSTSGALGGSTQRKAAAKVDPALAVAKPESTLDPQQQTSVVESVKDICETLGGKPVQGNNILVALRDKTPEQLIAIAALYEQQTGTTLLSVLRKNLSGSQVAEVEARFNGDERLADIFQKENRIEEAIRSNRGWILGAQNNAKHDQQKYNEMGWLQRTFTDLGDAYKKSQQSEERLASDLTKKNEELEKRLEESRKLSRAALELEEKAKALERSGETAEATKVRELANKLFNGATKSLEVDTIPDLKRHGEELDGLQRDLDKVCQHLETAYTWTKATRDGCVVAAATVASGGTLTAGGGILAAVGSGVASGTAIGTVTNLGKAVTEVAIGQKEGQQALVDAAADTLTDIKSSAISAVSAATGAAVAGRILPAAGQAVGLGQRLVAGAAAGGSGAAASTLLSTADRVLQANSEFNEAYKDSKLTDEQLSQAYEKFMQERKLTISDVLRSGFKDVVIGAVSGGIGAGSGVAMGAATSTVRRIAIRATELSATSGLSVMAAAADGELTSENIAAQATNVILGDILGATVSHPRTSNPRANQNAPSLEMHDNHLAKTPDVTNQPMQVAPREEGSSARPGGPEIRTPVSNEPPTQTLNLRTPRGAESQIGSPKEYVWVRPEGLSNTQITPLAIVVNRGSNSVTFDMSSLVDGDTAVRSKVMYRKMLSDRHPAVIQIGSAVDSLSESSISALKTALETHAPFGLKKVVVRDSLGHWQKSSGGRSVDVPALGIDNNGNLEIAVSTLDKPALLSKVLELAHIVERRLSSEELDYVDSSLSLRNSYKEQPGYQRKSSAGVEDGQVVFDGVPYDCILPGASKVMGGFYGAFNIEGQTTNRAFYISKTDPHLRALYRDLCERLDGLPRDIWDSDKVLVASALVRTKMKPTLESDISQLPAQPVVPLGAYLAVDNPGGECRHLTLTLAYLVEGLIADKKIGGAYRYSANFSRSLHDGHAFIAYEGTDGTTTFFDPTHGRCLPHDFMDTKTSDENGAWSYRTPEEVAALRGAPLWIDDLEGL